MVALLLTGLLDDYLRLIEGAGSKRGNDTMMTVESLDEDLAAILETHVEALTGVDVKCAPSSRDAVEEAFMRFLTAAFG